MVAWSSIALKNIARTGIFRGVIVASKNGLNNKVINYVPIRKSGHAREMIIRDSRYQYIKFKDLLVFYFLLGAIPLGLIIAYANIYIGPAKLAVIPEGYEPKHWEYFSHPISRFFARYFVPSPQERYERNMHHIFVDMEHRRYVKLENKIRELMATRSDYQGWYYIDPHAKFSRTQIEVHKKSIERDSGRSGTGIFF